MEFSDVVFFCAKGKQPSCYINNGVYYKVIAIKDFNNSNTISIFVQDESDLIAFKNSVLNAYEEYRKENYGK